MHIPDGYLGPATCLFFYIVMIPIWYTAFRISSKQLNERSVPLLAMLSAFAFLVMMFNWPVPDGTTAHMVGAVLIAILLGPWASVIAISVALLIQAFFFGDGGLTSYAANCFNMGVVIPFVGYYVYSLILKFVGKKTPATMGLAAAIGGYVGINAAAFMAGLELGIQPFIAPGYCPYPYTVSIPAMLLAHLVTAGPVEAVVTGSVVYYLKSKNSHLLNLPKLTLRGEKSGAVD
ncbi:MAG: cobalt transporter CbiM [Euryarchaeota archaeon]|nr:cobalt transporter CbiM [Euryarchaeota archaeon]